MVKNSAGIGQTILDGILEYLKQNDISDICKQRTAPEADDVSDGGKWYLHCDFANIFLDDGKVHLEVLRPKHYIEYHDYELADPEIFDKILKLLLEAEKH